jgi:hypothetical protein
MQFTVDDLQHLPLAAAFADADGVVAATPEWKGFTVACVSYPVRRKRLVVATRPASDISASVLRELLHTLGSAPVPDESIESRVRMLTEALRLLAGADCAETGTAEDVLKLARAGITARTALHVDSESSEPGRSVTAPAVIALVLVQLAANAETHAEATAVRVMHRGDTFAVTWQGARTSGHLTTSRRHADRTRWGMGFARIAADALGAVVYAPYARCDGVVESTVELGAGRLALPLAALRSGRISRSTRGWDEETAMLPGALVSDSPRLTALVRAARRGRGEITTVEGWTSRAVNGTTWIAVPPDDATERLQDILDGLVHERALMDGLPEATYSRVRGLALVLGATLGRAVPRVPAAAWRRRMRQLVHTLELPIVVPEFDGLGAMDPDVVGLLASRGLRAFNVEGDTMTLGVNGSARNDAVVQSMFDSEEQAIRLA